MELRPSSEQQVEKSVTCKAGVNSGRKRGRPLKSEQGEPIMRRVSARIATKQREEKEELVHKRVKLLEEESESKKKKSISSRNVGNTKAAEKCCNEAVFEIEQEAAKASFGSGHIQMVNGGVEGGNLVVERSAYHKVKETLRVFNKHYLQLVQEEEKRCSKVQVDAESFKGSQSKEVTKASKRQPARNSPKGSRSKKGNVQKECAEDTKKKAKRPDLKAITKMLETNAILYPRKRIGDLSGISVGHQFYSRAEMVVVGFHSHWLNGIDYMGQDYKVDYPNHTMPLAVSIVLSGMYEDDLDNAEDVVYTGQGGHNLLGNKRQIGDQKMERGNLALKNCMDQDVPVRVVRGHGSSSSYCGKVYTYDGLYKVIKYWAEKGLSGFTVYKYRLRRLEGQPILTTNQVHFTYGRVPKSLEEIRGLVCNDISGGQEPIPIPATNLVDDPPVPPTGFKYSRYMKISQNVNLPVNAIGCNCKGTCIDPRICACAKLNGSDFPYVQLHGGRLIEAKDVVYECGPNCGCGPDCVNRTSQKGLRYRFEVFRTPKKGWAVRSWDFIHSGALICEYIGVLMKTEDVDYASENNYLFDIDCLQTMRGLGGRERRSQNESAGVTEPRQLDDLRSESVPEYCIDAGSVGNMARFINHSCEPNLFVQCILSSHRDIKLARVMLFAADNIPPLQELTYDYGYALDSVIGPDGKIKKMPCFCGAADCRKRLF